MDELRVRVRYRSGLEYTTAGEGITWTGIKAHHLARANTGPSISVEFVGHVGEGASRTYATIAMSHSKALGLAGLINSAVQADASHAQVNFRDDGVRLPVPGPRSIE